jgi:hypothetical protein
VCDNAMHQQKQHASLADARASLAVEFFSFINMNLLIRSERATACADSNRRGVRARIRTVVTSARAVA